MNSDEVKALGAIESDDAFQAELDKVNQAVDQQEQDLVREQAKMNNYVQMLPRKMRRKILSKISFANRFKRTIGLPK